MGDVKADFNPRSREGSDEFTQWQTGESVISIHAPAKGATSNNKNIFDDTPISIHAPAKGATVEERPEDMAAAFQSTLPRRERLIGKRV